MAGKVVNGARAQLIIADPNTGVSQVKGVFNNVSYSLSYGAEPIYILGRFSPDEIIYTSQEAVSISASGWRVVDSGPHAGMSVPKLQDLLSHQYLELAIFDRQTNKMIAKIHSVRPTSFSTTLSARHPEEVSVTFMGLLVDDESTQNSESVGASTLP